MGELKIREDIYIMFDYTKAKQFYLDKQRSLQDERHLLWQKAKLDSERIVTMIIQDYAPKQIIQWGSVLAPEHFSSVSDIDLAVLGIEPLVFLRLFADAEAMTNFSLDLIRWEDIHPAFQQILLLKGKVIYAS